jgi:hypothetical protein
MNDIIDRLAKEWSMFAQMGDKAKDAGNMAGWQFYRGGCLAYADAIQLIMTHNTKDNDGSTDTQE